MIATMKQISLAYDIENLLCINSTEKVEKLGNIKNGIINKFSMMFAYIFNPSTFIFGPYITFDQFFEAYYQQKTFSLKVFF